MYSIPSQIKLVEAIQYNPLFRWFLDLPLEQDAWTQEAFSMNRDRFELHDLYRRFFDRVVAEGIEQKLISPDHFSCDGTLIRSLASHKSLAPIAPAPAPGSAAGGGPNKNNKIDKRRRKDDDRGDGPPADDAGSRDASVNWRGEQRTNAPHRSTTDPEARLARKGNGKESHLCHTGHLLMENRSGLCVALAVDGFDGHAERRNALRMLRHVERRHGLLPRTLGADAGYKAGAFLVELEAHGTVPHVPVEAERIAGDTPAAHARRRARRRMGTLGYRLSQRVRKRAEQIFGWSKTTAGLARTRFIGHVRIENSALIAGAVYNLLRMTRLLPA